MLYRSLIAAVCALALGLALAFSPARAAVQLDGQTIDGQVIPWVQTLANGDPTPPTLTLVGDQLLPTGDAWQAGASVTVTESGGIYTVSAHYDGLDFTATVQATER